MKYFLTFFVILFFISFPGHTQNKVIQHNVTKGETINQIAQKYKVTPYDIYQLNPDAQSGLKPNTILLIPQNSGKQVVVQAKKSTPKVQQEIDNCITQILASTIEVKHRQTLSVIKKRVATRVLEWLSLRKNTKSDVLDELCSVLLYNCVDIPKEVPQRLQDWDGKISEEDLKEFAGGIISAGHELDKSIQDEQKGRAPILNEIAKLKDLNYKDGIVKLQNRYPDLSNELLITLEGI